MTTISSQTETAGAFRQIIRIDAHTLHADTELAGGGGETAPSPHDLFDASLAACKALTACWYAKKNAIALDRVTVHVERDGSRERQGTYVLKVSMDFEGGLDAAQKQKLHDVVGRCPVHKLMTTTEVQIETVPLA